MKNPVDGVITIPASLTKGSTASVVAGDTTHITITSNVVTVTTSAAFNEAETFKVTVSNGSADDVVLVGSVTVAVANGEPTITVAPQS